MAYYNDEEKNFISDIKSIIEKLKMVELDTNHKFIIYFYEKLTDGSLNIIEINEKLNEYKNKIHPDFNTVYINDKKWNEFRMLMQECRVKIFSYVHINYGNGFYV